PALEREAFLGRRRRHQQLGQRKRLAELLHLGQRPPTSPPEPLYRRAAVLTLRAHKAAFTLIEMLVVIAIISVMMAIAVPTLHRIGIFGRDDVHTSARDLLTKLKAARIYAGANRVDTAVVYSVTERIDSETNNLTLVVDGMAI